MILCASITEKGGRKINEDSLAVRQAPNSLFCVLADGLGGHGSGEVASRIAVQAALEVYDRATVPFDAKLTTCISEGHGNLLDEQRRLGRMKDLKTTITLLQIQADQVQWAHVGDSRVYHFTGHRLAGRTLDHSVPQMLVNQGEIHEREIRHHEDRNRLVRVMGMECETLKYELPGKQTVVSPASFLLCSDGFWELVDEKEMSRQLKRSQTPDEWLKALEKTVLKNGQGKNMDNYSAIGVFIR